MTMRSPSVLMAAIVLAACEINPAFDPNATLEENPGETEGDGTTEGDGMGPVGEPGVPLPDPCPPLAVPQGEIITVGPDQAADLHAIVLAAPADSTVLLEPGVYPVEDSLYFTAPGVTLRSSTGNPQDVILDGQRLAVTIVFIQQPGITLAEMTLVRPEQHHVHISGANGVAANGVLAYRLALVDPGFAAFKFNPSGEGEPPNQDPADDGVFACSSIELTDAGRTEIMDPDELLPGECEDVGGVLGIGSFGWTVRDNSFDGLWCPIGDAGAAVRFIETSAHSVVERNIVREGYAGIILGIWDDQPVARRVYDDNPCGDGYFDHLGGVVRNNMVVVTGGPIGASMERFDTGIGLWNVCGALVSHNTVVSTVETFNSIEYRFARTQANVVNNLVTHEILDRDGAGVSAAGNLMVDTNAFVDPLNGDAHLVEGAVAIDAGVQLGVDTELHDIDGDPRDDRPDVGADER